ncbi:hypothetical protein C4J81_16525 [Deltaproteobacteria bacterium Smac51]|nr:hypothetical protein C4J81_16525 [Deltaproteobacteria bacterium Smac51]
MTRKNHLDFDSLYDLLVDVIESDPDVTLKGIAGALGISVQAVSRKMRREGNLVFRVDEISVILSHIHNLKKGHCSKITDESVLEQRQRGYLMALDYLAEPLGCVVIQLPETESLIPADLEMSELLRQFGELSARYLAARRVDSPGGRGLSRSEKIDLLGLACEVQKRVSGLIMAISQEEEATDGDERISK